MAIKRDVRDCGHLQAARDGVGDGSDGALRQAEDDAGDGLRLGVGNTRAGEERACEQCLHPPQRRVRALGL